MAGSEVALTEEEIQGLIRGDRIVARLLERVLNEALEAGPAGPQKPQMVAIPTVVTAASRTCRGTPTRRKSEKRYPPASKTIRLVW